MAIRISASGEYALRSASVPDEQNFTIAGWAYLVSDRAGNERWFFALENAGQDGFEILGWDATGELSVYSSADDLGEFSSSPSDGEWFYWAVSCAGTGGTDLKAYYIESDGTLLSEAVTGDSFTPANLFIGSDSYDNWNNIRFAHIKVWDAVLTQTEIQQEMYVARPVRTANLHAWWPMLDGATERLADYSGNGKTLTAAGTLSDEDGPPVSWGADVLFVVGQPAGGPTYTLTCDAGSYTVTGQAATLEVGRKLALDAGSYTVTGQAATLTFTRLLACDAGSYTVTGQAATLAVNRALAFDAGSYTVTGQDAGLVVDRVLAFDAGSYVVTGNAATLIAGRKLVLDAGSYTVTGQDATLTYTPSGATYTLTCDAGSYTVTGQTAGLAVSRKLAFDAGSYAVTGNAATLTFTRLLACATGSYAVTGQDPTLTVSRALSLATGSYVVTGQAVTLTAGRVLAFDAGSYTLTGQTIAFLISRVMAFNAGSYAITGLQVGLSYSGEVLYIVSEDTEIRFLTTDDTGMRFTATDDSKIRVTATGDTEL